MRSILYWSFLIFTAILLAYLSPFDIAPVVFLAGAVLFAGGYFVLSSLRRGQPDPAQHSQNQIRFIGSILIYVMVFWTTTGLFSNVKEQRAFPARYEPYVEAGVQRGYTFYYLEHPGSYERIDSPELNKLILEKSPQEVRMVLELVKDFGKLRAYTVRSVESVSVDKDWASGSPPWEALRQ